MGIEKEKKLARNGRYADKRSERRESRQQRRTPVDASDLNCPELVYCLSQVVGSGGALRIGATRDGGAWAFGVYGDGLEPYTDYLRPGEDVASYLAELGDYFAKLRGNGEEEETKP